MPPSHQNHQARDVDSYMDEIKRVLDQMNVNDDRRTSFSSDKDSKRTSSSSFDHASLDSHENLRPMQRAMSQDSDMSSNSGHLTATDICKNLEVLCSLGEGASGEVAKARIKTTGQIIARKVRAVC